MWRISRWRPNSAPLASRSLYIRISETRKAKVDVGLHSPALLVCYEAEVVIAMPEGRSLLESRLSQAIQAALFRVPSGTRSELVYEGSSRGANLIADRADVLISLRQKD